MPSSMAPHLVGGNRHSLNNHPPLTAETREQISSSEYEVLRALWNSLLFFSVLSTPLPPDLTAPARQPDSPRQPLRLFSHLKRYAVDLFDCEDKHYPQTEDLSSWRGTLARRTEELILENILKFEKGRQSLRFHASVDEMMASVREGLAVHISNLSKECASDGSKARQHTIGQVTSESAPSERIESTSLTTEVVPIPQQELTATTTDPAPDIRSMVNDFLLQCNRESAAGFKVTRKHIWLVRGHKHARQFQYWQKGSDKATAEDDRSFRRILRMSPARFIALLKERGIFPPDS